MKKRRMLWQLYPSYLLIILLSLAAVSSLSWFTLKRFTLERIASDLEARARLLEPTTLNRLYAGDENGINAIVREVGAATETRITIIRRQGEVVADSDQDPALMENHANRPEIRRALSEGIGRSTRFSNTLNRNMMYVAISVPAGGRPEAVIRTSLPLTAVDRARRSIFFEVLLGGLVVALIASVVSLAVSRKISRPLEEMKMGAERFADGDFTRKLPLPETMEISGLAEALNQMADQLNDRISTVVRQRNELKAVLASMVEGVIAIDPEMRIISFNDGAVRHLGLEPAEVRGKAIQEVVRNPDLQRFVDRTLAGEQPVEDEIVLYQDGEQYLQAHGTTLRDADGLKIGALIVLNDVTRLRRLENYRRDFVANVSHELRTPITSIKGFVETLIEEGLEKTANAQRFLDIIKKHTDRLNALIEDLLTLSRIEREDVQQEFAMQRGSVEELMMSAVQACQLKAEAKGVRIDYTCEESLKATFNRSLIEQALINLIDNAVKYSPEESRVEVLAAADGKDLHICVRDHGTGIAKEHLPRLFERFYRVDKGRSRRQGGTGLGLAIVKHIAQIHGGSVSVDSAPEEGSTFCLHLPSTAAEA